ncbi:MAG: ribonuclease D [Bdellovibrionales bacterium]|nr:ribonuclease D [Bdellovibrionales bacterium]
MSESNEATLGSLEPKWDIEWVDSDSSFKTICRDLSKETLLSIDTETSGWQTGAEKLCLIQVGIPSREFTVIIDPLAISDLSPLKPVIGAKLPQLIAHNASFEQRQFSRHGIKSLGFIDTLVLARELRPDLPSHSLQACCRFILDIDISKTEQTSDWSKRPLSDSQIRYASLDAELAFYLYRELVKMQSELVVDENMHIPELMQELSSLVQDRLKLTKSIATQLAIFNAREKRIRDVIREKLVEGESAYVGNYGKCSLTKVKRTEIVPELVRQRYPTIASQVIQEQVLRKDLLMAVRQNKLDESAIDEVTKLIGYIDRLNIKVN